MSSSVLGLEVINDLHIVFTELLTCFLSSLNWRGIAEGTTS